MQRNWDLVRKLLLAVESLGDTQSPVEEIDGYDDETFSYHVSLLIQAGLLTGECRKGIDGPLRCYAETLTWQGHEFLDKIRTTGMWNKIKTIAREKGLSLSFEVIKSVATHSIAAILGDS